MFKRLSILLLFAALAACGDDSPSKQLDCSEGETQACSCSDGAAGTAICVSGTFSACECGPARCSDDSDCNSGELCVDTECRADSDADGVADILDNCPEVANSDQKDADENGQGDACQTSGDIDSDGVADLQDNCPEESNADQLDADDDGIGDVCDDDRDGDGVTNDADNCPDLSNDRQVDSNMDGIGNACDTDDDAVLDDEDNCRGLFNPDQNDLDMDGAGDACDPDRDGDGVLNDTDICPDAADPEQLDTDMDGLGDGCEADDDNDRVDDVDDNCPLVPNPRQEDGDGNGIGDVCDDPDMDGIPDSVDNCPDEANPGQEEIDTDLDGILDCIERTEGTDPNKADTDDDGVRDADEFVLGTNPTVADTDMDGLTDGEEVSYGLDPTNPSTFNDGVQDGMRAFVQECRNPVAGNAVRYRSTVGDWDLALPLTFTSSTELSITGANSTNGWAASVFRNAQGTVAGFVYAEARSSSLDLHLELRRLTGTTDNPFVHSFVTHDGYPAITTRQIRRVSSSQALQAHRDALLVQLAGFSSADVTNFPAAATPAGTTVEGRTTLIDRNGQLLVVTAVAFDAQAQSAEINDAANSTGLSRAMLTGLPKCRPFAPRDEFAGTDVYWLIDGTGSMDTTYSGSVKPRWPSFLAELAATNVPTRFAMADMAQTGDGRPRATAGWMTTYSQMDTESNFWANGTDGANEYGLRNAELGISWLLSPQVTPALAPRDDAALIFVTITDEESQSFQNVDYNDPTVRANIAAYSTFFAQNAPFYGLVPVSANCTFSGGSEAYQRVATESGGWYADFCQSGIFAKFHDELADIIAARGSEYRPLTTPISSTIKVTVGGQQVPRGGPNGWEYFVETNSIVLRGTSVPALNDPATGTAGQGVAIVYEEAP